MKKEPRHTTERILNLTLEIIYLLTGEDYGPVKKPADHIRGGRSRTPSPIVNPPPPSLRPDRNHNRKILEVTRKIIELLTGEVPIRCQDVSVYFSMEEWEYLEGHRDLYKDVVMEDHQTITSPGDLHDNEVTEEDRLVKKEPLSTEEHLPQPDFSTPTHHTQPSSAHTKEEPLSADVHLPHSKSSASQVPSGRRHPSSHSRQRLAKNSLPSEILIPDVSLPTYRTQPGSAYTKTEPLSTGEHPTSPDVSLPTYRTQPSSAHAKEVPLSVEEHLPRSDSSETQKVSTSRQDPSSGSGQRLSQDSLPAKIPSDDKPYGCCGCGRSFETNAELIKHRKIHTGQKPYSCSECGKCFLYNSQLVTHQRIHTGERPFACSECGKSFIKNAHLVTHQRSHTGEKPFGCPECGKCFVNNTILQAHLRVHSGDMPFDCAECGKSFVSKSSLTKHQKYHSREKPFSCSECGRAFLKNSDLTRHLRIHTGERPYCCSDCDKRFIQKSSLVLHQRTHTGQRPYSCAQCGKGFHFKTSLVKHESNHTEKRLLSPNTALSSGGPAKK